MNSETLASLAAMNKLELSPEEEQKTLHFFSWTLSACEKLKAIDISGASELIQPLPLANVMRDDLVVKKMSRAEILANAPEQTDGCFVVPKVVEAG